jgi:aryl-alcohol dehydrogenase-like predicted oxidoreductase
MHDLQGVANWLIIEAFAKRGESMRYRTLGNSDLQVSEIALGSWLTYGSAVDHQRAEDCINRAFDVGINFIDTANVYGRGAAESLLGRILKGRDRNSFVLATKLFFPMSDADRGLSRAQIHKQIDASLKRLDTDYVDLYQCHRYDPETPLEETLDALSEVVQAGKARYVGFSEWQAGQIQAAIDADSSTPFVSSQPQYSMLWRHPESDVMPLCAAHGIRQIVFCPLAQGVLTGKYLPGGKLPGDSRANDADSNRFMGHLMNDQVLEAVQKLEPIARSQGLTLSQLALAWILRQDNVASAIIGATRPEQISENAAASGRGLDATILSRIDQVLGPVLEPELRASG